MYGLSHTKATVPLGTWSFKFSVTKIAPAFVSFKSDKYFLFSKNEICV
jgi:hypothetical protein